MAVSAARLLQLAHELVLSPGLEEQQQRLRREAGQEQQARVAEKIAHPAAQFRDLTPGDIARLRLIMNKVAEADRSGWQASRPESAEEGGRASLEEVNGARGRASQPW